MNYKLEKFWNIHFLNNFKLFLTWTINLKSFEITVKQEIVNGMIHEL